MNPLAIRATNLRTFETLELDLPDGCTVIGGANGAGKSTILSAIDVALFAGRGELTPLLTLGEEELGLELTFEHAGEWYRVRRGYSAKGRGKTTFDLEQLVDGPGGGEWQPLTRETADETQNFLEQLLGLSRATFRASSFLAQGDGAAFTEASPRDRKAILAEILGLDVWDRLLEVARRDLRKVEDELVGIRARIEGLVIEARALDDVVGQRELARVGLVEAQERHVEAQGRLERAQKALADNAAALERLRLAEMEMRHAQETLTRTEVEHRQAVAALDRSASLRVQITDLAEAAETMPALEAELAESQRLMELVAKRDQLVAQAEQREEARQLVVDRVEALREHAAELFGKADHLDAHIGDAGDCDRCGQKLGAEAAARAAESFRAEARDAHEKLPALIEVNEAHAGAIAELREQADEINNGIDGSKRVPAAVEADLRRARTAREQRASLEVQLAALREMASRSADISIRLGVATTAVAEAEAAHLAAAGQVADVATLQGEVETWSGVVARAQADIDEQRANLARLEEREQRARAADEERKTLARDVDEWQKAIDTLKVCERAYGRDGVPALIVENAAIPQLEVEANRILGELGGATADCRIELRTQRALKTSDTLRETLDIIIVTPQGERPYETFSGGERTRLNLSLRIALARLLAHRRGAESRLLAIDEPEFLDDAGVARLADVLRGLAGDFDRVLLVSHHPTLATSFDQAIVVVKDGDRSRIDAGAPVELEAAAA